MQLFRYNFSIISFNSSEPDTKKRLAGICKGVLSGADDTAFDEKITRASEGEIS